ncbi:MAG TPA: hypothetical protein VLI54_01555 [Bacillota bacterium]|nr:hypothetical protein [Bacillota bacterium]
MATPEYIPLTDLEGSTLGPALPSFDLLEGSRLGDRIGVDADRLGSIALRGGFYPEVELHPYNGDTTRTNVAVMGMNQGVALAGAVRAVVAESGRGRFDRNTTSPFRAATYLDLMVNMSEVEQRVTASRLPVREASTWAPHLDQAVRAGLRQATWQHLVKNLPPFPELALNWGLMGPVGAIGAVTATRVMEHTQVPSPALIAAMYLEIILLQGFAVDVFKVGLKKMRDDEEVLRSAVPFVYVDRAVVVSARTRFGRPLIRSLS